MSQQRKGRLLLIGLFAIFMLPIGIALALQTPLMHWEPAETRNFGTLIQPPKLVLDVLGGIEDPKDSMDESGENWTLLFVPGRRCEQACIEAMDLLTRVRETQGREIKRVRLVTVIDPTDSFDPEKAPKQMRILRAPDAAAMGSLLLTLGKTSEDAGLFIVDPSYFAMMRYTAPVDGTAVRKDLGHLLRWVEPNRPR